MAEGGYRPVNIMEGMWSIEEGGVRSFLIEGGGRAMLVDTGFGSGDIKSEAEALTDKPLFVVNTHADRDHTGCNAAFGEAYMHPAEYDRYSSMGSPEKSRLVPMWEGEVFDLGSFCLEVMLIPGHTPGSVALLEREKRFLIAGDSVQNGNIFLFGPGRNLPAYIESLRKLEKLAPLLDTVYASHAALSVSAEFIPALRRGAETLLAGGLQGTKPEMPLPGPKPECLLYNCGVAGFLY